MWHSYSNKFLNRRGSLLPTVLQASISRQASGTLVSGKQLKKMNAFEVCTTCRCPSDCVKLNSYRPPTGLPVDVDSA